MLEIAGSEQGTLKQRRVHRKRLGPGRATAEIALVEPSLISLLERATLRRLSLLSKRRGVYPSIKSKEIVYPSAPAGKDVHQGSPFPCARPSTCKKQRQNHQNGCREWPAPDHPSAAPPAPLGRRDRTARCPAR
jgi:hypothetical protein